MAYHNTKRTHVLTFLGLPLCNASALALFLTVTSMATAYEVNHNHHPATLAFSLTDHINPSYFKKKKKSTVYNDLQRALIAYQEDALKIQSLTSQLTSLQIHHTKTCMPSKEDSEGAVKNCNRECIRQRDELEAKIIGLKIALEIPREKYKKLQEKLASTAK